MGSLISVIKLCTTFSSSVSLDSPSSNPSSKASSSVPLLWEQRLVLSLLGRDSSLELFFPVEDSTTDTLVAITTNLDIITQQDTIDTTLDSPHTTTPPATAITDMEREKPWKCPRRSSPGSKGKSRSSSTAVHGSWR